ncbi:hypothetical protein Tco_0334991 [Tanacetum coccineum]
MAARRWYGSGGEVVTVVEVMMWCRRCGGGWWVWRGGVDGGCHGVWWLEHGRMASKFGQKKRGGGGWNSDEEITDTAKADAEKTEELKDDIKKAKLSPSSFSLCVSSGFSNQFLNISSDKSTVGTFKDSADADINSLLDLAVLAPIPEIPTTSSAITPPPPHPVSTISPVLQQITTPIPTPPITTEAPPITTVTFVVTTIPDPLSAISQRVSVLEKDVQELKVVDHTTALLASLRS